MMSPYAANQAASNSKISQGTIAGMMMQEAVPICALHQGKVQLACV
jgi:hypothetical protein